MQSNMIGTQHGTTYLQGRTDSELNRLLCAAVVNARFCEKLLADPVQAATQGYCGETFVLSKENICRLNAIRATNLADFAAQLIGLAESSPVRLVLVPCD